MTESEWLAQLTAEGYDHIQFCEWDPHWQEPEQALDLHRYFVVFSGDLHITAGYDDVHLGADDWYAVDFGASHQVRAGKEGCRFLLAMKV